MIQMAEGRAPGQQTPISLPESLLEPPQLDDTSTASGWGTEIDIIHPPPSRNGHSLHDSFETAAEVTHKLDSRQLEDVGARDNPLVGCAFCCTAVDMLTGAV